MKKSIEELEKIRKITKEKMKMTRIMICSGTGCTSSKSKDIIDAIDKILKEGKLKNISVEKTGCFGFCAKGPIVVIDPEEIFYEQVKAEDAADIIDAIVNKTHVERLMAKEQDKLIEKWHELNFYNKQERIALKNCGKINPENIDEYLAVDGYKALEKVLTYMTGDDVINVLLESGLRGRGGAGFPTGKKWLFAKASENKVKYVCCNADEGDPGAFMDRSILEGDPHAILEAMAIAGYTIGAKQGYIYVRAEYPIAVQRLNIAIKQAKEHGLLGKNILGKGFDFDIELDLEQELLYVEKKQR